MNKQTDRIVDDYIVGYSDAELRRDKRLYDKTFNEKHSHLQGFAARLSKKYGKGRKP